MTEGRMRILFYYDNYCGPESHGGTEVATFRIATALKSYAECEVFNAFLHGPKIDGNGTYSAVLRLRKASMEKELAEFISRNEIDVIVNMGRFFRQKRLARAIKMSGKSTRLLFMHHFAPGSEKKKPTFSAGRHLLKMDPTNPLYWLRASVYPLVKLPRTLALKRIYREVYELSDRIILLSDGYAREYLEVAGMMDSDGSKFYAIPNIYDIPEKNQAVRKEKRVLILSRMDEIQKRISLALDIWKKIEDSERFNDWNLDIVGSGHEMKALKKYSSRLNLRRATFHGWQDSKPYLERSSILMSTSDYEGLSLAMIEAMAYGCIPIAFNSYASLRDVIEDGNNGVVVESPGDVEEFSRLLSGLMADEERRLRMTESLPATAERFSSRDVASRWLHLLQFLQISSFALICCVF